MSQAYAEYVKTNAEMGKNATVTEKLANRQQLLEKQHSTQKEKVAALRMELEEMSNSEEKNEQAIARKQKELTLAEGKLISYGNGLSEVTKELQNHSQWTDKASEALGKVGDKATEYGKKTAIASAAAAGGLVAAGKAAIDMESAFTGVNCMFTVFNIFR